MEKISLGTTERNLKSKAIIRHNQHGVMKGKPLISFYDKVTHLVDRGTVVDVIFLNFSKVFESIPHSIFLDKLSHCEVNKYMLH